MKLLDVCEMIVDCPHSTAKDEGKGYPLIRTPNVGRGRLKLEDVHRVSAEVYDKRNERAVPQENDLILAREAPVGNVAIIKPGQEVCLGQRTVLIRPNQDLVYPDYLVYYLLSPKKQHALLSASNGATVSHLNMSAIRALEVELPEIEIQRKIGRILAGFDDKIELNRRINKNLASQLQSLYLKDFDPTTHIPDGKLSDICHYSTDRIAVSALTEETYYSTENMLPYKAGAVAATSLPSVSQTTRCHIGDVIVSNIRPYFQKIIYIAHECGCSTDVLCFVPEDMNASVFLYATLYADRFFDYMVAGSKGTKMPRGDKHQVMQYPVVLPKHEQLADFNRIGIPMLTQMLHGEKENERLCMLRDSLLPRLISGELDISGINL